MSKSPKYQHEPPKLATRFLHWYCRRDLVDEVEGDLYELFQRRAEEEGLWKAKAMYWLNVLLFLHQEHISIFGRVIGFISFMHIFLYVQYELSNDQFHKTKTESTGQLPFLQKGGLESNYPSTQILPATELEANYYILRRSLD